VHYQLNHTKFKIQLQQPLINESQLPNPHRDWINPLQKWYPRGYTALPLPATFFKKVRQATSAYIAQSFAQALNTPLKKLTSYHLQVPTQQQHLQVLQQIGKLLPPEMLGIDTALLEKHIQKAAGVNFALTCRNMCDIRIFRPYNGNTMDNNPLHRDTWLPAIHNGINLYIPIAGNNRLSSLSVIPGSHLWNPENVERTQTNALINGVQYGLPSVANIKQPYRILRPALQKNEALLFSSNLIHGGAVNLNKNTTRVSIEIRFWKK
jgi:hypothetical protein